MIDPIDRQWLMERLGIKDDCRECQHRQGPLCNMGSGFVIACEAIMDAPSTQGDAEFINWLLDEVWDEEIWELNYRSFPELLCRRLVKAGWLKEEDGKYVRLDNQITVCPMCPDCPDNCPLEADMKGEQDG